MHYDTVECYKKLGFATSDIQLYSTDFVLAMQQQQFMGFDCYLTLNHHIYTKKKSNVRGAAFSVMIQTLFTGQVRQESHKIPTKIYNTATISNKPWSQLPSYTLSSIILIFKGLLKGQS